MRKDFKLELKVEHIQGEKTQLFTGIDMILALF